MNLAFPRSPYDQVDGVVYLPRMLDKIRRHLHGELAEEYHANLGSGFDALLCEALDLSYDAIKQRVAEGGTDKEILAWCTEQGCRLSESRKRIWNDFIRKVGWKDGFAPLLKSRLEGLGMGDRSDVLTIFDLIEVDENRPPRDAGA